MIRAYDSGNDSNSTRRRNVTAARHAATSSTASADYNFIVQTMRVARFYHVNGRVQGVGFRWFVQEAAAVEGLHGWVRNLPDGRVEIRAEGDAEALERFEWHVRVGPRGARVDGVEVTDVGASGLDTGFSVR